MSTLRDELAELLGEEALEAELPRTESMLRRQEPVRLPLAKAVRTCASGQVVAAQQDGEKLVVAKLESGETAILADICPHDGGLLSDGFVEGELIICARHGWEFEGTTGMCRSRDGVSVPCHRLSQSDN